MKSDNKDLNEACRVFEAYLRKHDLKLTSQRIDILNHFLHSGAHVNAEELFHLVRSHQPKIGYSTVYRTLKLLKECQIAKEHNFGDGTIRYENDFNRGHHDHLICMQCGTIIEFECPQIEEWQQKVAESEGFELVDHRLEIYGRCKNPAVCTRNKKVE
ncbi:MAG: transcriptional repressor [Candidatus Cloacimonetes bacterium]|nr:transcriptional repressor [Candidatus Cloacimonadota bacterium]